MKNNGHYDEANNSAYIKIEPNYSRLTSIVLLAPNYILNVGTLGPLLGFEKNTSLTAEYNESPKVVDIASVDNIIINCDLCDTSYHNGERGNEIYTVPIESDPGYSIITKPSTLQFHTVNRRTLSDIHIWLTDQDQNPIDLRNERVNLTLRLEEC